MARSLPSCTITGIEQNVFDRVDFSVGPHDTINLNLAFTRSWFQTPNSYDAQNATAWSGPACALLGYSSTCNGVGPNGQVVGSTDQRSKIRTFNIAPNWTHTVNANAVFTFGGFARQDQYDYTPSRDPFADLIPDLQLQTIGQGRTLTDLGLRTSYSYLKGVHNVKIGATYQDTIISENDSLGVVDPTSNAVCLNSDGSPDLNPLVTSPTQCTGRSGESGLYPSSGMLRFTRTGTLPASDGCPNSNSGLYTFHGHANIRELALYIQDTITLKRWTFNLGFRFDYYDGWSPRPSRSRAWALRTTSSPPALCCAFPIPDRSKRLSTRIWSYPAWMQQSGNRAIEASTGVPAGDGASGRDGAMNFTPASQQAFGKYSWWTASTFGSTRTKPTTSACWAIRRSPIPSNGAVPKFPAIAVRGSMPNFHGFSAFIVLSHVSARFFEPQVSGIGSTPGGSEVFRIDHDERFNATTHLQYQSWKKRAVDRLQLALRQRPGGGAGAVRWRQLRQRSERNGSIVDVSGLTPDQQYQAGLYCGNVHATPTTPISPTGCARHRSTARRLSRSRRREPRTTTTIRRVSPRATCSMSPSATTTS